MVKQTEYGVWLTAQKMVCDAQIEWIKDKTTSVDIEAEAVVTTSVHDPVSDNELEGVSLGLDGTKVRTEFGTESGDDTITVV